MGTLGTRKLFHFFYVAVEDVAQGARQTASKGLKKNCVLLKRGLKALYGKAACMV